MDSREELVMIPNFSRIEGVVEDPTDGCRCEESWLGSIVSVIVHIPGAESLVI